MKRTTSVAKFFVLLAGISFLGSAAHAKKDVLFYHFLPAQVHNAIGDIVQIYNSDGVEIIQYDSRDKVFLSEKGSEIVFNVCIGLDSDDKDAFILEVKRELVYLRLDDSMMDRANEVKKFKTFKKCSEYLRSNE